MCEVRCATSRVCAVVGVGVGVFVVVGGGCGAVVCVGVV